MRFLKSAVAIFLAALFVFLPITSLKSRAVEDVAVENADAALVYNFENDTTVFELNSDGRLYPTSTVKVMTGIIAVEQLSSRLDEKITVTAEMLKEATGNNIGLKKGEVVPVRDLLYALLTNGANDAALVLAHRIAGSSEAFVEMMNQRALELGAVNTHYTNPTGLHDNAMVTTLHDTFLIAKHAYTLELLMQMTSTAKYVMEATNMSQYRNICNRNALISSYYATGYLYSGAYGMNAGSTNQGNFSLITTADNGTLTYLVIVMGGKKIDDRIYSYENAIKLLDWAFEAYAYRTVLSDSTSIAELPVTLSSTVDYVTLVPSQPMSVFMRTDVDLASEISISWSTHENELPAPIKKGQECGTVTVMYQKQILGSVPLVATADVSRSEFLYFLERVSEFTKSRFFRASLITAVVLTVAYVLISATLSDRARRRGSIRKY